METFGTSEFQLVSLQNIQNTKSKSLRLHKTMAIAMVLSDLTGILLSALLAGLIRGFFFGPLSISSYIWLPIFILAFILSSGSRKLYPAIGMSDVDQFRNLTVVTCLFMMVIVVVTFFIHDADFFSRLLIGISWLLCLIIIPFNRTLVRHILSRRNRWGEPVAIVGAPESVDRISKYFLRYPKIGLKPELAIYVNNIQMINSFDNADDFTKCIQQIKVNPSIETVIVAFNDIADFPAIREVFRDKFENVILISPNNEHFNLGGVSIKQYGDLFGLEIHHSLLDFSAQLEKRIIDIIISVCGLLLLSPLLSIISLLIAAGSPGGVFYKQKRIGKGGREFEMLKFRTMRKDAEQILQIYLDEHPKAAIEWQRYQKLQNDPRITSIGRLLRRYSLDELPQLFNVLKGEMSIVGPRPIILSQQKLYTSGYCHYIRVLPGITGLWQISGRNSTSFAQRQNFDTEYVNSWSIWMDIFIIIRTFWVIIRSKGAY